MIFDFPILIFRTSLIQALRPSLMGPKSRILEIWNRAIFGFQEKILSYGLEIGPFSRIWFSRIGRGRQILENGHPFSREIGLSGKWSLCYMVRLLATPMVFVWLLILVAVEQIYDQITRRLVAQKVAPGARVILSQTPSFRRWRLWMETMAYCGSRYRCRCHDAVICLYSRDLARWYQQDRHSSKNLSSRKCTPNNIPRRVGPREEIPWVDSTYVCLQLNCCCDSQSGYDTRTTDFSRRDHVSQSRTWSCASIKRTGVART